MADTYDEWLKKVNRVVEGIAGVGIDDLADTNTRDMYEDGESVVNAANRILEENDFPSDED